MTESVEIDPFDSNRLLYGTGATIYGADNLTDWDTGGTVHISVRAQGLEETAVLDLISPPAARTCSPASATSAASCTTTCTVATEDVRHPDLRRHARAWTTPSCAANVIVRVGNPTGWPQHFGISTDSGATWTPSGTEPAGVSDGGTVAVSADGSAVRLVARRARRCTVSTDYGATWTAVGRAARRARR